MPASPDRRIACPFAPRARFRSFNEEREFMYATNEW